MKLLQLRGHSKLIMGGKNVFGKNDLINTRDMIYCENELVHGQHKTGKTAILLTTGVKK